MKLLNLRFDQFQDSLAFLGQPIVLTSPPTALRVALAPEPPQPLHPVQQRIQRAGTDFISMPAQLRQNPLPVDGLLIRMMEDVNLPKAEQNLPVDGVHG